MARAWASQPCRPFYLYQEPCAGDCYAAQGRLGSEAVIEFILPRPLIKSHLRTAPARLGLLTPPGRGGLQSVQQPRALQGGSSPAAPHSFWGWGLLDLVLDQGLGVPVGFVGGRAGLGLGTDLKLG